MSGEAPEEHHGDVVDTNMEGDFDHIIEQVQQQQQQEQQEQQEHQQQQEGQQHQDQPQNDQHEISDQFNLFSNQNNVAFGSIDPIQVDEYPDHNGEQHDLHGNQQEPEATYVEIEEPNASETYHQPPQQSDEAPIEVVDLDDEPTVPEVVPEAAETVTEASAGAETNEPEPAQVSSATEPVPTLQVSESDPVPEPSASGEARRTSESTPLQFAFTTPSKALPALKDIEKITTPKSFSVARDADDSIMESSPMVQNSSKPVQLDSLVEETPAPTNNNQYTSSSTNENAPENSSEKAATSTGDSSTLALLLNVPIQELSSLSPSTIETIQSKLSAYQEVASEVSLLKINQEQMVKIQDKKLTNLHSKIENLEQQKNSLQGERDELVSQIPQLESTKQSLTTKKASLEEELSALKAKHESLVDTNNKLIQERDLEISKAYEQSDSLAKNNVDINTKLGQLSKELNDTRNEKFSIQLNLNKCNNELSYIKTQKVWFENELKSVQSRYTELIKKHETEYVITNNKLTRISATNDGLEKTVESQRDQILNLQKDIESYVTKTSNLSNDIEVQRRKFLLDIQSKQDLLELTQVQSKERNDRITQLESYIDTVKEQFSNSVSKLEKTVSEKSDQVSILSEKLKRTEEVLDEELRKETELPKLSAQAEKLASMSAGGMSLSSLYTEFSHLKKQLVMERTQKEKLAHQLESFIEELEAKKPAISNYREQIKFYESSLQDSFNKIEEIRMEKLDVEKFSKTLSNRVSGLEGELVSMKTLCKDLGRQLCFYLIHSKIRDEGDGEPLSVIERKAIENILAKSGAGFAGAEESDTDKLISERLVGFSSIIELQSKNQELLTVVRQLGKQLENKEAEFSRDIESVAIEEAKEAIITLQGELESVTLRLNAAENERNIYKDMCNEKGSESRNGHIVSANGGGAGNDFLQESNRDLQAQLKDLQTVLNTVRRQSEEQIKDLQTKLRGSEEEKSSLNLKVNNLQHSVNLTETRFKNSEVTLKSIQQELERAKEDGSFWKQQTSKQETAFINASNKLRNNEGELSKLQIEVRNLSTEKNVWTSLEQQLEKDINQLKADKTQLSEFVNNLQSLLKDREESAKKFSDRLDQSIENYQNLQNRLQEKEERIMILSSQSELSMKAQNTKLEQLNEISQMLVDTRLKLAEKTGVVERLTKRIEEFEVDAQRASLVTSPSNNSSATTASASGTSDDKLLLELDSLRKELRISEKQVEEFSSIAKSAEGALVNSTSAFEELKNEAEKQKVALEQANTSLSQEVDQLRISVNASKQELHAEKETHSKELETLRYEAQQFKSKADAYDELQRDYEAKIQGVTGDLQVQIKLVSDFQEKYQQELVKNDSLNNTIIELKDSSLGTNEELTKCKSELEEVKLDLQTRLDAIEEVKQSTQEEVARAQVKLQDLQNQNQILLNQLELEKKGDSKDEVNVDDSGDGSLREVVNFLRHEKDSTEAKLSLQVEENARLNLKLKHLNIEVESTKSELRKAISSTVQISDLSKEHEKLLEQLQQLNILRESNTTLRNENESNAKKVSQLSVELDRVSKELDPLKKQVLNLRDELDVKEQNVKLVTEELDRYKARIANATAQNSNDNVVTELQTEIEKLKKTSEAADELKSENEKLKKGTSEYEGKIKELSDKIAANDAEVQKMRTDNEKIELRFNNLKVEAQDKLKRRAGEVKDLKDTIEQLKSNLEAAKANAPAPTQGDSAAAAGDNSGLKALQTKLDEVEKEKLRLIKENANLTSRLKAAENSISAFNKLKADYERKISEANKKASNNTSSDEIKSKLEKEYQSKQDELHKQIKDNLEKEFATKLDERISKIEGVESVREELKKQYEEESQKLKDDFSKDLEKAREETRKLSEKTTELRVKMLNKKISKLTEQLAAAKKSPAPAAAPASLPVVPNAQSVQAQAKQQVQARLQKQDAPQNESTLVVNRPAVERVNNPPAQQQGQQQGQANSNSQKRPFEDNQGQASSKRPKE